MKRLDLIRSDIHDSFDQSCSSSTDTDQNTGNLNTGIHYNTGKKAYDGAFYLLNTGNWNSGIVLGDFYRVIRAKIVPVKVAAM